ncbi:MAG: ATP-binding cassette domain-containing protein [Desulfofustis sp.]|nr:ATP-binding cassette domain-containing protein [Desulfofustis sp.]RZW21409.1 MAG: ATP-binding cassette domain-containing protein [Desulfobulbaceae bacterium]MBT8345795.1 ATP-binding cassette domain-containing protein [Desulfofustis sp.]MBT8355682.1 ATP-binding cassette domain-containing protein [Desulfofustis sp.]NNF46892.1 ATP-binding cassette domain-containing protein [Desulfofustis sp.]
MTTTKGCTIKVCELVIRLGDFTIHDGLSLQVYNGEITSVVGASGTGKSVLLKTIIGLIKPIKGSIEIFGQDYNKLSSSEAHEVRRHCGVLFQDGALFGSLTVNENIQIPIKEHFKLPQKTMSELSALKLSMVGLDADVGNKYPSELSGGMRKRVGLARALALDPELLFLDEPTAGLDPIGAAAFDQLLLELQENLHLTVFIVTHDLDTIYTVSNRIAVLGEKKLLVSGTIDEVRSFDHPWVQDYFHGQRSRAINQ